MTSAKAKDISTMKNEHISTFTLRDFRGGNNVPYIRIK